MSDGRRISGKRGLRTIAAERVRIDAVIKALLSLIIWVSIADSSLGQRIIAGQVSDQDTRKPIPFANIGILNSNIGTISNEDGSFSIPVPASYLSDTLLFSALGYHHRSIAIVQLTDSGPVGVALKERITILDQVTISGVREKKKSFWLGNKFNKGGHIYADSAAAGSAMALLIENKYPAYYKDLTFPVFVEKALLKISVNTVDEFKVRVRFLDVDSITELPGKDLLHENVIVTSGIHHGWLTFDLSRFNLRMAKPFFLVFEWILEDKDRLDLTDQYKQYKRLHPEMVKVDTMVVRGEKVAYYNWYNFVAGTSFGVSPIKFSLDNYQCYYRNNSFGLWKRASAILTARILVSH